YVLLRLGPGNWDTRLQHLPWEPPAPIILADFRNIGDGQKTVANPAGHGATWQGIFSNTLPTALSTRYRQPFGGARQDLSGQATGRPNPWGSPGGLLPAQFANSFPQETRGTGMPVKNVPGLPLDAMMPMNTGFSAF
ncbi:hypothetical protein ACPA9J_15455, partial [Pseudomonas aeruginosa]